MEGYRNSTLTRDSFLETLSVHLFIISTELSGLDGTPPGLILLIPLHRGFETLLERNSGLPANLAEFTAIYRIAFVMAGTILHKTDQTLWFSQVGQQLFG